MSTTPTLTNAEIDEVVYACRQAGDDSTYAIVREAVRRAALTQGAGEAVEPVATFVERADGRPVATAVWLNSMPNPDWDLEMLDSAYPQFAPHRLVDLVRAQQLQQAVARGISEFLERTGQYVTNDASREAAITDGVARALAPIQQAIRDYHYALDTRQHGGMAQINAFDAICRHLDMDWQPGQEAAIRAKGTHD